MKRPVKQLKLVISSGRIKAVYDDALTVLFADADVETRRASHVEPDGKVWNADLRPVDGPLLAGFRTRQEALNAERYYLDKYVVA